jgi:uncharacterized membrane protein (DUF373 family)
MENLKKILRSFGEGIHTAKSDENRDNDAPWSERLSFTTVYNLGSNILHCLLGAILLVTCTAVVVDTIPELVSLFSSSSIVESTAKLVDKTLFVMLILEIGHTVLISYKEHVIRPEPFLVVGIIASIRRILALTIMVVEFHMDQEFFYMAMVETAMLSVLILILVGSIIMIRRWSGDVRFKKFDEN